MIRICTTNMYDDYICDCMLTKCVIYNVISYVRCIMTLCNATTTRVFDFRANRFISRIARNLCVHIRNGNSMNRMSNDRRLIIQPSKPGGQRQYRQSKIRFLKDTVHVQHQRISKGHTIRPPAQLSYHRFRACLPATSEQLVGKIQLFFSVSNVYAFE